MSTASAVLRPDVWHQTRVDAGPRAVPPLAPVPAREPRASNGGRVTGVPSGDGRARFSAVVVPHLDDAFALARWLTGNRADAEDVVQEACLRAYRAIATFGGGNPRAWVLTIVRHTAYTWLGKNRSAALLVVD